jgi:hypothetical protein
VAQAPGLLRRDKSRRGRLRACREWACGPPKVMKTRPVKA